MHPTTTTSTTGAATCPQGEVLEAPDSDGPDDDAAAEARRRWLASAWPEVAFASA